MAVTAISFALPFHFFKALWVKENGQLIWIFFKNYRFATVTNLTIQETLYDFCYFQFDFCFFFNFFSSFSTDWSNALRWFCLLEEAQ